MWHEQWKKLLTRTLITSLTVPATLLTLLATAPTAHAFVPLSSVTLNEVVPNDGSGHSVVELYNGSASATDISGYTISDASGVDYTVPASTTLPADSYYTVTGADNGWTGSQQPFATSGDSVILKDASSNTIASLEYGKTLTSDIVEPGAGTSLSWIGSTWYSGTAKTVVATTGIGGSANVAVATLHAPTAAHVKAGASNAINMINNSSKATISVDLTADATSVATNTLTALIYSPTSLNPPLSATATAPTGSGTVAVALSGWFRLVGL